MLPLKYFKFFICIRVFFLMFTFVGVIDAMLLTLLTLLILQAAAVNIAVGSVVWVEDPDMAWIDGKVVQVNGEEIKIICTNEKTVC